MTLQLDWLRGCATALVTPFAADGAVDEKRLRELIEYQIAGGVRVLVPCGTTGESVTMTEEENSFVIRTTVVGADLRSAPTRDGSSGLFRCRTKAAAPFAAQRCRWRGRSLNRRSGPRGSP